MTRLRVLIACEQSGVVRRAFRERDHDAWSCDLLASADGSPFHIQGDVLPLLKQRWDLVIAHPECRYLSNSGIKWLYRGGRKVNGQDPERWDMMREAAAFYAECWNANAPTVAVENSGMHPYAMRELVRHGVPIQSAYRVQPWMFAERAHDENDVKKAALILSRGLPRLRATGPLDGSTARPECFFESPGPDRSQRRSRTKPGLAAAMADQWGQTGASLLDLMEGAT